MKPCPSIWIFIFFTLLLSGTVVAGDATVAPDSDDQACAALSHAKHDAFSVTTAEFIHPPFHIGSGESAVDISDAFCRVAGTAQPVAGSDIHFEIWLPPKSSWNGKLAGVGSGGSLGSIAYEGLREELTRKYATVATDNGHTSTAFDVSWALGRPDRIIDFGYRAEHVATQAGKALTAEFYGRSPQHSYFIGCSQGGHHGLTEAERFPDDYDGILAGAPVYSLTDEMAGQAWNVRALRQIPLGALRKEKQAALYDAVAKACAGVDGLIDDPRRCSFDPAALQCKAVDGDSCLTAEEVGAVRKMYEGPRTSAGAQVYPGLMRGGEADWRWIWSDPAHLGGSWQGFYRFMAFDNPAWDVSSLNFDRDPALAREKLGSILNPDNPDLTSFAYRGGKLIVYHGWGDDMVPSLVSVEYRDKLIAQMGESRASEFYRLFMIPGMAHCGGGPGADVLFYGHDATAIPLEPQRDLLTALEQWVEHARAPSEFVASRLDKDGKLERTRLVCPYPGTAKYRGQGDVAQAANFTCSEK